MRPSDFLLADAVVATVGAVELYDLKKDPDQLNNVADDPAYAAVKKELAVKLTTDLKRTGDPRIVGGVDFDKFPYLGDGPKHPNWRKKKPK